MNVIKNIKTKVLNLKIKSLFSNRFLNAALPKSKEFSFLIKGFIFFLIFFSFIQLFEYSGNRAKAAEDQDIAKAMTYSSTSSGIAYSIVQAFNPDQLNCKNFTGNAVTAGVEQKDSIKTYQDCVDDANDLKAGKLSYGVVEHDFGPIGMMINSGRAMVEQRVASPGYEIYHYANKATGRTLAASPTSGSEMLAPMLRLSKVSQNIAYGAIVIILVISAFSTLLSYLGDGEQKLTLIQLLINTGLTLFFVTFFYQFASVIYDISVNYMNELVASVMEPYINAKVILDRLQTGQDMNITVLLNVFQFAGISEGIVTVANNVFYSVKPAITQSIDAFTSNIATSFPLGAETGALFSIGGGVVSYFINGVISSVLGSAAIFDALIAFAIFSINLKIWLNLMSAFISIYMYVIFGPLMMLNGITGGYDKIKNVFKTMFAYGLVFPATFLFILMGSVMMNFYVPDYDRIGDIGTRAGKYDDITCAYQTNDPTATEEYLANRQFLGRNSVFKNFYDDPSVFRRENTEFQDAIDVVPASRDIKTNQRDCASVLTKERIIALPAPLGNYGNRVLQQETNDILIKTFMAIAFLVLATRATDLLKELLNVDEMKSLQGLGGVIKGALKPMVGAGSLGLSMGPGVALGLGGLASKIPIPFVGKKLEGWAGSIGRNIRKGQDMGGASSVSNIYGKLKGGYDFEGAKGMFDKQSSEFARMGMSPGDASNLAMLNVSQAFQKLAGASNGLADSLGSAIGMMGQFTKIVSDAGGKIGQFTALMSIDDI